MRLHDFILENREQILEEWETFARTCSPASVTMDVAALRDHAGEMLTVIAADLETRQDHFQQSEKAQGHSDDPDPDSATAAEEHGAGRAESGFTVAQMVAEYRALRASVLRLWTKEQGELRAADVEDLTRFNEAIDQALAESVSEFNDNVENAREMFLATLHHPGTKRRMRHRTPSLLLLALTASLTAGGCRYGSVPPPGPAFGTREVRVASPSDTAVFQVEVAATPEQHAIGLMGRDELPASAGMLFLFEEEQPAGTEFWMHRTHVPLSVALLDADGVIRQLLEMEPCASRLSVLCPRYRAEVPFHAALEVNRGALGQRGIGVGHRLLDRLH